MNIWIRFAMARHLFQFIHKDVLKSTFPIFLSCFLTKEDGIHLKAVLRR